MSGSSVPLQPAERSGRGAKLSPLFLLLAFLTPAPARAQGWETVVPGGDAVYLAPGTEHCVINRPSFYTQAVGGKKFADWLTTLLAGADPGQVR